MERHHRFAVGGGAVVWLRQPLNSLSRAVRTGLVLGLTVVVACVSMWLLQGMEDPFLVPDANQYLRLAQRHVGLVHQPFASRPLAPWLVRGLSALLHTSLQRSFLVLGLCSLVFTLLVVLGMAAGSAAPRWMLLALAALPFWPLLLHGYALPDLWYAAVLCGFLLCLETERPLLGALMLFPLMLSRESTLLTLVCLLAVGWRQLRIAGCALAGAAVVAGSAVVRALSAGAPSNPENLPTAVYLAAKVPWNLLRTAGVVPWSNVYPVLCPAPLWQHRLALGPLRAVGVCGYSSGLPLGAVFSLFTVFGLLLPLCGLLWRGRRQIAAGDLLLRFCLMYGGVSLVLSPMLGTAFPRLFAYAWPLFLVALPRLFPVRTQGRPGQPATNRATLAVGLFLGLQAALAVLGVLPGRAAETAVATVVAGLGVLLLRSPAGRTLRFSATGGGPLQRGKIATGKTPEQAEIS